MERPEKLSGKQGEYIEYLEKKLEVFSSKKSSVRAYIALKKIVDDTTELVIKGINVVNPDTQETVNVPIISEMSLTNKDDKSFDRTFKVIDKLPEYAKELTIMEAEFSEDEISHEVEKLKGENSVEGRVFN